MPPALGQADSEIQAADEGLFPPRVEAQTLQEKWETTRSSLTQSSPQCVEATTKESSRGHNGAGCGEGHRLQEQAMIAFGAEREAGGATSRACEEQSAFLLPTKSPA